MKESLLGPLSPFPVEGLTDSEIRECWDKYGSKVYDPTKPRVVRMGADTTGHCLHPDDRFMTRLPAFRPRESVREPVRAVKQGKRVRR